MSLFCNTYPGCPYVSPSWPTSDDIIPAKLFASLFSRIDNVQAMQALQMFRAVAQAIGSTFGGKDGRVQEALRELVEQAQGN